MFLFLIFDKQDLMPKNFLQKLIFNTCCKIFEALSQRAESV